MDFGLKYDLERFIVAQRSRRVGRYTQILESVASGKMIGGTLCHIFPRYPMGDFRESGFYGFENFDEAIRFYAHPVLGYRLREITEALLSYKDKSVSVIVGENNVDGIRACMTLFDKISPDDIFAEALNLFFVGERCEETLFLISADTRTLKFQLQTETTDVAEIDNIVKDNFREYGDIIVSQLHYFHIKEYAASIKAVVYKANVMNMDLLCAVRQALENHVDKSRKYRLLISVIYGEKNKNEIVRDSLKVHFALNEVFMDFITCEYESPDWSASENKSGLVFNFVVVYL